MIKLLKKYLDSQSIKGASINLLIGQAIITFLFLVFDYFIARKFSLEIFSSWKQLQVIINIALPIFAFGLPEGYKYFIAFEPDKARSHNQYIFSFLIFISFLVLIVSLIFGKYAIGAYFHNPLLNNTAYIVAFLFFCITLNRVTRYQLINAKQTDLFLKGNLIAIIFSVVSLIILTLLQHQIEKLNLVLCLGLIISISFFFPSLLFVITNKEKMTKLIFQFKVFVDYLKIGFPLYLATFMSVIILNIDKTIISRYESLTVFGIYAAGGLEIPIFAMLSASFSQSTFPKYVELLKENKKQEAIQMWISITNKVSQITYPILFVLMFFAKSIFITIYSTKLLPAVAIFKVFLLLCLWRNNYYGSLISASGKTKWITFYNIVSFIIAIPSCWSFYKFFGYKSLPWVIVILTSFMSIIQLIHEGMIKEFITKFVLRPYNLIMILLIISAFIFSPF